MVACFNAHNNYDEIEPYPYRCVEDAAENCDGEFLIEIGHSTGSNVPLATEACFDMENTTEIKWQICNGPSVDFHCVPEIGGICAGNSTVFKWKN